MCLEYVVFNKLLNKLVTLPIFKTFTIKNNMFKNCKVTHCRNIDIASKILAS